MSPRTTADSTPVHTLTDGRTIFCDCKANADLLDEEIFCDEIYSKHGITFSDGDVVIDAGANIGLFLVLLNDLITEGTVYCFEPVPGTYDVLQRNRELHSHLDARTFNLGLSDKPGQATFTHFPRNSVVSTMHPLDDQSFHAESRQFILDKIGNTNQLLNLMVRTIPNCAWYPTTELIRRYFQRSEQVVCELTTLSDFIDRERITRIDLLKIDTEGAEHKILAGLNRDDWSLVRQVIIEVHDGDAGKHAVTELLEGYGFNVTSELPIQGLERVHVLYGTRGNS